MDTAHLREFAYLAETLSFKRTAEHFFVSRSVVSRHMAALEEAVGARLVERGNKAVELTPAGVVFQHEVMKILRACDVAMERVAEVVADGTRTVRVGYLRNAARPVLVPLVGRMRIAHPDMRLELVCMEYADLRRALGEGDVDVAIAVNVSPEVSRNYRSTRIYDDRFYALMAKGHPLASHATLSLADLPADKLLQPDSFVYADQEDPADEASEPEAQRRARELHGDADMMRLKVQTEGYVALASGRNSRLLGDYYAIVPLVDDRASFTVSAFYRNGFEGEAMAACRSVFESLQDDQREAAAFR